MFAASYCSKAKMTTAWFASSQGARLRRHHQDRKTYLPDATPLTLGQEISGWAA